MQDTASRAYTDSPSNLFNAIFRPWIGQERVPELDGLRGLAIFLVIWVHCFRFQFDGIVGQYLTELTRIFWIGVDLFFVLSGYLITGILLKIRSSQGLWQFYKRRAARTLPAYYLIVLVVMVVLPSVDVRIREAELSQYAAYFLFHFQNSILGTSEFVPGWPGVVHLWSLAVEEQFYFLWPLLIVVLSPKAVPQICLSIIGMSIGYKTIMVIFAPEEFHLLSTLSRIDGVATGALIASSARLTWKLWRLYVMLLTPVAISALLALAPGAESSLVKTTVIQCLSVALFAGTLAAIHYKTYPQVMRSFLTWKPLLWLGHYSYGIYLLHAVILFLAVPIIDTQFPHWIAHHPNLRALSAGCATLAISLPLAVAMWHLIEKPAMNLARKRQQELTA